MAKISNKTFNTNTKDINYLNRDFSSLRDTLINFTKYYYPNNYKDFSESSPGQIFIEQAAYVGDVLSYYTDQQFQESFIQFASERKNIINLARTLGYKPKVSSASTTYVNIYQLVPAKKYMVYDEQGNGTVSYKPDEDFFLILKPYTSLTSTPGVNFLIEESVDFNQDTFYSPREISVYERDANTYVPTKYLVKKTAKAISGTINVINVSVGQLTSFLTIQINDPKVLKVLSVVDSDNNKYYEVDYLAQETIPISIDNSTSNNEIFSKYQFETPKILKYLRTERRFITYIDEDNTTYLQFGGNYDNFENDIIIPNPTNVGAALQNLKNLNISLDGRNVLKNSSYGVSPNNTTLTITYISGGGLNSNVNSGEINKVNTAEYLNDISDMSNAQQDTFKSIVRSLTVENEEAATGGDGPETNEMIRQNAIANFSSQYRAVTSSDILLRIYSLASEFGSVTKAFVEQNSVKEIGFNGLVSGYTVENTDTDIINLDKLSALDRRKFLSSTNPFTNNIYLLAYDINKHLTKCNEATLYNLKNYLENYKILTDKYNFIDGYIINIGVDFKISVYTGFNKKTVLNSCIETIKEFFEIDKMQFCQPINISQLRFNLMNNEGVQSVSEIKIKNLTIDDGEGYSEIEYNIDIATKDDIVYPSKDPSVFELKYPDIDIKGLVI